MKEKIKNSLTQRRHFILKCFIQHDSDDDDDDDDDEEEEEEGQGGNPKTIKTNDDDKCSGSAELDCSGDKSMNDAF